MDREEIDLSRYLRDPEKRNDLFHTFKPWMLEAFREHILEGWSAGSFPGKYRINVDAWPDIVKGHSELKEMRDYYNKKKKRDSKFMGGRNE